MTAMEAYEAGAGERSRAARRDYAERTDRDALLKYLSNSPLFPGSVRRAAIWATADQLNPMASLELLAELWTEYRRTMGGWTGFHGLLSRHDLRKNISAVVALHRKQHASVNAQAAMNGFLKSLAAE